MNRNRNRNGNSNRTPWKDILSNDALADDMVIQIGDTSATLGELRAMNAADDGGTAGDLDAREQRLQQEQATLISAQNELARMFQQLSDITGQEPKDLLEHGLNVDSLNGRRRAGGNGNNGNRDNNRRGRNGGNANLTEDDAGDLLETATGLDRDDPLLRPVLDRLQRLESTDMKAIKDELKRTQQALGIALKVNMEEHYERVFNSYEFPKLDEKKAKELGFKKPKLEDVLKYATDNGMKDKHGRLNVSRALDELVSPVRQKLAIAEAEERGAKRVREEQSASQIQPPGSTGQRHQIQKTFQREDGTTKDFGDVLRDAANDSELWNSAAQHLGGVQVA